MQLLEIFYGHDYSMNFQNFILQQFEYQRRWGFKYDW